MTEEAIKGIIEKETIRFKKRVPFLTDLKLTVVRNQTGEFTSKSFFKLGKKTIYLKSKANCPKALVKKSFSKIVNIVTKRKKSKRINISFEEAA